MRELLCLLNAQRLSCEYQWKQHVAIARTAGVSESQIAALGDGDIYSRVWSTQEKALLGMSNIHSLSEREAFEKSLDKEEQKVWLLSF
jgi:AhpD family alkylhydroperoxidase